MRKTLLLIPLLVTHFTFAQQTVNHHCDFSSGNQNMWGPSFSAFTINQTIDIFSFPWNVSGGTGNGGIVTILGQSFGAAANFGTSGVIGSDFTLSGFTTGEVKVDYPVDIELDMTTDNTYNQGEEVTINTSYEVTSDYALDTYYPSVGSAKLDMYFQISANADITVCAFGCVTVPIIPSFASPTIRMNIFNVSASGIWYLGPACAENIPYNSTHNGPGQAGEPSPGQNLFPFSLPPSEGGCTTIPWQVHETFLPLEIPDNDLGISGELTIPYVVTEDELVMPSQNLHAYGDSTYVSLSIEVFKLIGGILAETTGPPKVVGEILSNLSGEFELPSPLGTVYGASLSYNVMSASFNVYVTNTQQFDFKPKIYGKYQFPVPVNYTVFNGATQVGSGTSSIINCQIGNTIKYFYPCYYADVEIVPTYTIVGDFTNHTYDSINFTFDFSALQFGFNLPGIEITPSIHVPRLCVDIPYPCPSWSHPFDWCSEEVCTPEFTIPAVEFSGYSFNIGPLLDYSFPLGDVEYDWYNNTWQLEGFVPISDASFHFHMKARVFTATQTHTNILCKSLSSGAIDVSTVNGTAPFTYSWTNGAATQDITGLPANNYDVIITDANGCRTSTGATIIEPNLALSASATTSDKLCNTGVNSGAIDVLTQGGTIPYTYAWSNGANSEDLTGLNVGTYTLTVTDNNGCTTSLSRTISQPTVLGQIGVMDDANCTGSATGGLNVTPFGGVQPYTYAWSNGTTTEDLTNVIAGAYTLIVTDNNGCTNSANYNIIQPATLPAIAISQSSVACYGGNNGSVNVTPSGGTSGYTFSWIDASSHVLPYVSEDLTNVPAGNYTVNMVDSKGCQTSATIAVTQPAAPLDDNPVLTHINCFGNTTGAITTGITGGTTSYSYAWTNGAATADLTNVAAGSYGVTVTDNRGCTATYNYVLNQPAAALGIVLTPNTIDCFGNSTGTVSSLVTGGTAPYNYSWSSGQTSSSVSGVVAGSYTLTVLDDKGCSLNNSAIITQPAAALTTSLSTVSENCYGGSNGSVDLTVTGGTTPYTYQWSDATNQILTTTGQDLSSVPSGGYYIKITDDRNCLIFDTAIVIQPAAPIAITGVMNDVNCFGTADGGLDATVTGGTFPYTYSWSNGPTSQDLVNTAAGTYTLTVTDNNSCQQTAQFEITQPLAPLSALLNSTPILCYGQSNGEIQSFVAGGTAPYTYSWSNSATSSELNGVAGGPYSLTVTDSKGCFTFTGTVVEQPSAPLNVIPVITDASCYGYADGEITLNLSGGTQPYSFSWANNNQVILNNPSEHIGGLAANDYLVRVYDRNNCSWEQILTIGQPTPFLTTLQSTDALCNGTSDGNIQMQVIGGTQPYSVLWSNGETTTNATNLSQGEYSVIVTDDQGCIVRDTTTVGQPLAIYLVIDEKTISCIDQKDASIDVIAAGGIQPYTYLWSTGGTSTTIDNLQAGTYTLTITDAHGCIKVENITVDPAGNECVHPVNTFTPNGDNYNDTWIIDNLDLYPNAKVEVFNKWGNLVHSQQGVYQPWDGTYGKETLPSDVYYYIIDLYNDTENKYTGSITIIR